MGFLDRLLGREEEPPVRSTPVPQRSADEIAVERYEYLLRTAPPETIEQVHTEAFAKLTPKQRDILFDKLTENASPSERPADARPESLAQAATRAELQQPGTLTRTLGGYGQNGGPSFGSMVGSSLLGSVAGYVIGSTIMSAFMPNSFGDTGAAVDGGGDGSGSDGSGSDGSASDGTGGDATVADASADGGYDTGGYDGGFGGDDFGGGGDFGDFGF